MTKRISIIALIISFCAAACGLIFVDTDEMIYEWQNGPPLVTAELLKQPESSNLTHIVFQLEDNVFCSVHKNTVVLRKNKNENLALEIHSTLLENGFYYTIIGDIYKNSDKVHIGDSMEETTLSIVSERELNEVINHLIFPVQKTRKQKKRKLQKGIANFKDRLKPSTKVKAIPDWKSVMIK